MFTHILPSALERYLAETARVLMPGGRCLATFFLLNDESLEKIGSGESRIDFRHDMDGFRTSDARTPESAIAYPEERIRMLLEKHGLAVNEPIRYGSWCGRKEFLSYQDLIVAGKR